MEGEKEVEVTKVLLQQLGQMNKIVEEVIDNQRYSNKLNIAAIIIIIALFMIGTSITSSVFFVQYFKTSYTDEIEASNTNTNINTNTNTNTN